MVSLTGQVALITGAGSGIGAALARAFSQAGASLVLVGRRAERLRQTAADCPAPALELAADVTDPDDRAGLVARTIERHGRLDILCNNAGVGFYGDLAGVSESDWRRLFEVNFFAAVFLTQAFLPLMSAGRSGLIVNVASIGGLMAHSDKVTPYVASKHALVGFSRGLAKDLAGTGVRVKVVCPHLTRTDFFGSSAGAEAMEPILEQYSAFMDSAEEVAQGVLSKLDEEGLILFPTDKPAKAYARQRDV
ncbi:MAG: SDR family oxidoreductase [Thermodesulfobacteriota bacterium]